MTALYVTILLILLGAGIVGGGFFLWIMSRVLVSRLAEQDKLFTFRKDGYISHLMEGDNLVRYLFKYLGHTIDQVTGEILEIDHNIPNWQQIDEQANWVEKIFGAYWIGFPPRRIKKTEVVYDRPIRPDDFEKAKTNPGHYKLDEEHNLVRRSTTTTHLPIRHIYSIHAGKIEVKGFTFDEKGSKIEGQVQVDIWGTFTLITHNARIPVLELEGKSFPHVRDGILGHIADSLSDQNLDEIRKMAKAIAKRNAAGKLEPSEFENDILEASLGPSGTQATTGFEILAFNVAGFEVTKGEVEEALEAKTVATLRADAKIQEGRGIGGYEREVRTGIADGDKELVGAIKGDKVVARVLIARARAEGMKNVNLTGTYVEGGNPIRPVLPLQHPNPAPNQVAVTSSVNVTGKDEPTVQQDSKVTASAKPAAAPAPPQQPPKPGDNRRDKKKQK